MTRETKIGLLLGMGVILLIGIIISDQLSQPQQNPADFTDFATDAQRSIDASDAAPGYAGIPDRQPAAPSPVIDPPNDFFIPSNRLPPSLSPRQADRTPTDSPATTYRPLTAYNVGEAPSVQRSREGGGVPTLRLGNNLAELPHNMNARTLGTRTGNLHVPRGLDSAIRHTVLKGETLTKIARRYYGNGDHWRTIAQANPSKVTLDGQVRVGAVLDIPKRDDAVLNLDLVPAGSERLIQVDIPRVNRAGQTIEVVPGDTLSELAAKHLGSASKWQDLLEANRDQIDDVESLRVGMKLRLPGTSDRTRFTTPARNRADKPERGGKTYTVRPGDNLTEIAEKMLGDGNRWDDVFQANRDTLKSPDRLMVGQELRIPG